jgi:hypothetical protein
MSGDDLPNLEVFIKFDEFNYWLSRTRDLIAKAETYSYAAFQESFRELQRETRNSEMDLLAALFKFDQAMKGTRNGCSTQGQ